MSFGDQSKARGYMNWATADSKVSSVPGTWTRANATGGGRWAYQTDGWGGTTYISPVSCSVSFSGKSSGGLGSTTVVWTFTAKPAWASNPLTNCVDVYTTDTSTFVGWLQNQTDFQVVANACTNTAATPSAPVLSGATASSVLLAINPADSSTDIFSIRI